MKRTLKCILGVLLVIGLVGCSSKKDRSDIEVENGGLVVISAQEVMDKIDNKDTFVFILTQTGCSHCQQYEPHVVEVCQEKNIQIYQIIADKDDADSINELMERYGIEYTPTTFVVDAGEIEDSFVGSISTDELIKYLKKHKVID